MLLWAAQAASTGKTSRSFPPVLRVLRGGICRHWNTFQVQTLRAAPVIALLMTATAAGAQERVRLDGSRADPRLALPGVRAIVLLFTSTDCPVSNRYAPEVRRLAKRFGPEGVAFRLIYPNPSDVPDAIREHMTAFEYGAPTEAFYDPDHALVNVSGATVTPEAVVYAAGRIVYRGRIDDRYVDLGRDRPVPTAHDLADALKAVLAGSPVAQPVTQAVGCFIADFKR
jgi:hypothetical protein